MNLNRIPDHVIDERLAEEREALATWLSAPPVDTNAPALQRYHTAVGRRSRDAGLFLFQRGGAPDEVRALLRRGAASLLEALTLRPWPDPSAGDYRWPGEFREVLDLIAVFGDSELGRRAAVVPEWKYRFPVSLDDDAWALYLDVLKRRIGDGTVDEAACDRVEARAEADVASKQDRLFLGPDVRALRAITSRDGAGTDDAIEELVASYAREAMRGEYRFKTIGLMCLPGLRLARFALDQGLRCTVKSPYLPLDLLERRA